MQMDGTVFDMTPEGIKIIVDKKTKHLHIRVSQTERSIFMSFDTIMDVFAPGASNVFAPGTSNSEKVLRQIDECWNEWSVGPLVRAVVLEASPIGDVKASSTKNRRQAIECLKLMCEETDHFVGRVGSMRSSPTRREAAALGQLLGQMRDDYDELASLMSQLKNAIDFAAVGLVDTLSLSDRS